MTSPVQVLPPPPFDPNRSQPFSFLHFPAPDEDSPVLTHYIGGPVVVVAADAGDGPVQGVTAVALDDDRVQVTFTPGTVARLAVQPAPGSQRTRQPADPAGESAPPEG
jgi:hypothetical protein